jgi:hypothetical protein
MLMRYSIALFVLLAATAGECAAGPEFQIVRVNSVTGYAIDQIKPYTIIFNDNRADDTANGFVRFDDWTRLKPIQKQYMSLFPTYSEHTVTRVIDGVSKTYRDEMQLYIVEARLKVSRPPSSIDLKRYTTLPFIENVDPAIKHQLIKSSETTPLTADEKFMANTNPDRKWCEGPGVTACVRSHYKLEGKLPIGIALANKIREGDKKIFPFIDFESEMRLFTPADDEAVGIKKLTGLDAAISGVLEQSMFYVNQVMRFGKFMAVFQQNPNEANSTIVTVTIAVAVSSTTLDSKKKYQDVPVLKNLVPLQVLMGNSSFNTGSSISAGLPVYVKNRVKALAGILDHE